MSKTYIQLGRFGDVMNVLPFLWHDAQKGEVPRLMVGRDFASLLEGVNYVKPLIYDGPHTEIAKACEAIGEDYCCTQVNGPRAEVDQYVWQPNGMTGNQAPCFEMESWRAAGRYSEWNKDYPLVFDNRDGDREKALVKQHVHWKNKRPILLVSRSGVSSPFPYGDLLWTLVKGHFSDWLVIDLAEVKAERIYDLLGLYEVAEWLISTDSAPLHLARACPKLKVAAITNDTPSLWHGSCWRPNHMFYCRYSDWPKRAVEMLRTIKQGHEDQWTCKPDTVQVTNGYDLDKYGHSLCVRTGTCARDSKLILGDTNRVPFLKDCIRMGISRCADEGKVIVTRPDRKVELDGSDFCYAHRMDSTGAWHTVDLFCAPKAKWKQMMPEIPDLLFDNADHFWSHCLWAIFKKHGAVDKTGAVWKA